MHVSKLNMHWNCITCNFRGLLSSHILAEYLQQRDGVLTWYRGELLHMAKDVGYRLLPAFNTTTGIPHARVCPFPLYVHSKCH